jgi:4-diphosphocytidyl-2-C-methyl-D-erythritol kinase
VEYLNHTYLAPAKVNFVLKIGEKNPANNLHYILSIIRRISVFDRITFKINEDENKLKVIPGETALKQLNEKELQEYTDNLAKKLSGEDNLIIKASNLFFNKINLKNKYICAVVEKNIPMQAGLGGGSSDAAGMLNMLNKIYNNPLNYDELNSIAIKLGSDVSFFLKEEDSFVAGNGEIIIPIARKLLKKYYIAVIVPKFGVSTKEAYEAFDDLVLTKKINYYNILNLNFSSKHDILKNIDNVNNSDSKNAKNYCNLSGLSDLSALDVGLKFENDFENVILALYPILKDIKNFTTQQKTNKNANAEVCMLSGSGSAMFGVFKTKKDASAYITAIENKSFSSQIKFRFLGETDFKEKLNQLES